MKKTTKEKKPLPVDHKTFESTFMLTDGCMWEKNKKEGTNYPHSVEVVNVQTGQMRYIRSGSIIKFVDGQITANRDQTDYNKETQNEKNNKKSSRKET